MRIEEDRKRGTVNRKKKDHTKTNTSDFKEEKKASEKPFERNSATRTLQLSTINTTVRKICNEVCAVTLAQVYEGKIQK